MLKFILVAFILGDAGPRGEVYGFPTLEACEEVRANALAAVRGNEAIEQYVLKCLPLRHRTAQDS